MIVVRPVKVAQEGCRVHNGSSGLEHDVLALFPLLIEASAHVPQCAVTHADKDLAAAHPGWFGETLVLCQNFESEACVELYALLKPFGGLGALEVEVSLLLPS